MESTSYVLSFRMFFSHLVTTGWIFDISLCENSIDQSINQSILAYVVIWLDVAAKAGAGRC